MSKLCYNALVIGHKLAAGLFVRADIPLPQRLNEGTVNGGDIC